MMYYYLCSSLPSLAFGKSAPLTAAEFDALCAESLAPAEYERLLSCPTLRVPRDPDASLRLPPVYAAYTRFEQYLAHPDCSAPDRARGGQGGAASRSCGVFRGGGFRPWFSRVGRSA